MRTPELLVVGDFTEEESADVLLVVCWCCMDVVEDCCFVVEEEFGFTIGFTVSMLIFRRAAISRYTRHK